MNTKNSQKPVSKYAQKQARGGSKYWVVMRAVFDAENLACAIRMERARQYPFPRI